MDSVGEGEGGKIWENGIETCEMSCMKRDASPGSMPDAGCLGLVHWDVKFFFINKKKKGNTSSLPLLHQLLSNSGLNQVYILDVFVLSRSVVSDSLRSQGL